MNSPEHLRVTYLELRNAPAAARNGDEKRDDVRLERLTRAAYLELYRRVGGPLRWDTRLKLTAGELDGLLAGSALHVYVLRERTSEAVGFCEFDRSEFPSIELKHFGLVPEAQGRGLGSKLLTAALVREWQTGPERIWLHTDTWDHPAAVPVYQRAGFRVYDVRFEPPESL